MALSRFDNKLEEINQDIIKLGALIEESIKNAVEALINQDQKIAEMVISNDKEINALTARIEREALHILLKEHPVASDLRAISTTLKVVTDMERIGDQASDICEIVIYLSSMGDYQNELIDIPMMAEIAKTMVNKCVEALVKEDYELSTRVIEMDTSIDKLFHKVKDRMINLIRTDSEYADQAIYLMMVAKYFEKIGDHAENIAEWVQFFITGKHKNVRLI